MTSSTTPGRFSGKLRRLSSRAEIIALSLVIVACGTIAMGLPSALAGSDGPTGKPVPQQDVDTIVVAALSCPALNPPKLSAQLMAASGFDTASADGYAGLDSKKWTKFKPSSAAQRRDRAANIMALAHATCETVGQLRAAKVKGDLWKAAVGGLHSSVDKAISAKGVPAESKAYVRQVSAYAEYYADQDPFKVGDSEPTTTSTAADKDMPVPDKYVSVVQAAGRICPTVTAVKVAAQLRAVSGFNPNLKTANGDGIAQFSQDMWNQYQPGRNASVWKPRDAVMAMGTAMCDLVNQFSGLTGSDPHTMAVAAWQWSPMAVRQANGLPRANVPQLSQAVAKYEQVYAKDARLTGKKTGVAPTASATPSKSDSTKKPSKPEATESKSASAPAEEETKKTSKPKPPAEEPKLYQSGSTYQLVNPWAKDSVLELPGGDINTSSGTRVQLYQDLNDYEKERDQFWKFVDAPDDGYVNIINAYSGLSLGIQDGSKELNAKLSQITSDASDHNQQWSLRDAGDGQVHIYNRNSGKIVELLGNDFGPPKEDGTWNEYWVEQYDADGGQDQKWRLDPR
jgi:hypothetical protein